MEVKVGLFSFAGSSLTGKRHVLFSENMGEVNWYKMGNLIFNSEFLKKEKQIKPTKKDWGITRRTACLKVSTRAKKSKSVGLQWIVVHTSALNVYSGTDWWLPLVLFHRKVCLNS